MSSFPQNFWYLYKNKLYNFFKMERTWISFYKSIAIISQFQKILRNATTDEKYICVYFSFLLIVDSKFLIVNDLPIYLTQNWLFAWCVFLFLLFYNFPCSFFFLSVNFILCLSHLHGMPSWMFQKITICCETSL